MLMQWKNATCMWTLSQPVCALLCVLCVQIVVMREKRGDWWMFGRSGNEQGLFPSSYVELLKDR